jgi:hypothetical protein
LASELSGSYYAVAQGRNSGSFWIYADVEKFLIEVNGVGSFRIYADVEKFLIEVNGVVGALFKGMPFLIWS